MDSGFLNILVDNGFRVRFDDSKIVVLSSSTEPGNDSIDTPPAVRIPLPKTLGIRFLPNQNKRTSAFPPKNPPRVRPNYHEQKFDTREEYQDHLYDSYMEKLEQIVEQRKEKIDARLDKHAELRALEAEVAETWKPKSEKKEEA